MLSITKLQNLKAIHNSVGLLWKTLLVVINHKTTKFESNSQLISRKLISRRGCYQSQNYKIWKQFTTIHYHTYHIALLLSITKLQDLKAIHNSYSFYCFFYLVVINHKTTKFESNSQLTHSCLLGRGGCYQSQNYKIWKQFTTIILHRHQGSGLLSIAKLQNLKSNSQLLVIGVTYLKSCYQSQNYKIWKQFTT